LHLQRCRRDELIIVVMDNLGSHKVAGFHKPIEACAYRKSRPGWHTRGDVVPLSG
jgi:hypothetical protein